MKLIRLSPKSRTPRDLLQAVAQARLAGTPDSVPEFLDPDPLVLNPIPAVPAFARAAERLDQALQRRETIVVFGDYDCDGITALVQVLDLIAAAGHRDVGWFIPDRMTDDYGLSQRAAEKVVAQFSPGLLIAVDCGSPSIRPVGWLQSQGVDCIIIDHHQVDPAESHPAFAHLNPKASQNQTVAALLQMQDMSAAGLAFLFCEAFAKERGLDERWSRGRALILAGLGTVVDLMPLRGINRALAKQAIRLAADPVVLRAEIPGLAALGEVSRTRQINVRTFGFHWGPRLNASGRLDCAAEPVHLLLARTVEEARPFAEACEERNRERQGIQREMEGQAMALAQEQLASHPGRFILLLARRDWHPGVVGIVASHIKDAFNRPAILCGWHGDGFWKGSGRSIPAYDIGSHVRAACQAGFVLKGGGHRGAAGLAIAEDRVESALAWLDETCCLTRDDLIPQHEILSDIAGDHTPDPLELARKWHAVFERLEPFGPGNPRPLLLLERAALRWGPRAKNRRDTGEPWAFAAGFSWNGRGMLFAEWADPARAAAEWHPGGEYDLALSVTSFELPDTGRILFSWKVRDSATRS